MASKKELLKMLHEAIALEEHIFVLDYSKYLELLEDEGVIKLLNRLIQGCRGSACRNGDEGAPALSIKQKI